MTVRVPGSIFPFTQIIISVHPIEVDDNTPFRCILELRIISNDCHAFHQLVRPVSGGAGFEQQQPQHFWQKWCVCFPGQSLSLPLCACVCVCSSVHTSKQHGLLHAKTPSRRACVLRKCVRPTFPYSRILLVLPYV